MPTARQWREHVAGRDALRESERRGEIERKRLLEVYANLSADKLKVATQVFHAMYECDALSLSAFGDAERNNTLVAIIAEQLP